MNKFYKVLIISLSFFAYLNSKAQNNPNYDVGVFYMPFWKFTQPDPMTGNWKYINAYDSFLVNKGEASKARIPMNIYWPSPVWYDETMISVTQQQMELMSSHEMDFVVFDSFWVYNPPPRNYYVQSWQHVIENVISPGFNFHGMKFAIMWADEFTKLVANTSCERFLRGGGLSAMVNYWSQYFNHPQYKKIDGKPVFYIYYPGTEPSIYNGISTTNSIEGLCGYCKTDPFFAPLGASANEPNINNNKTKFLLEKIEQLLGQQLYFVAVLSPHYRNGGDPMQDWYIKYDWLLQHPQLSGFDAVTSYGYKYFDREDAYSTTSTTLCNLTTSMLNWNYNYATMQSVHNEYYNYMINNSTLNYQVPVSAGWNRGPLNMAEVTGGVTTNLQHADPCNNYSRDPLDQAISNPATFEQSLYNAKNIVDANPTKTKKIVMISAWNEYAEGTTIEPSYTWGNQYIDKVKNVFKTPGTLMANINDQKSLLIKRDETKHGFSISPNPIVNNYTINLQLLQSGNVTLTLYNFKGKLISRVLNERLEAGKHQRNARVNNLEPGIYFFTLESPGKKDSQKVVIQ